MLEYRECLWPNHTVVGKSETISPFIPLEIGGPPAATNTIPGYGTQNRGPWLYVPLEVRRGNCPGTEVEIVGTNALHQDQAPEASASASREKPSAIGVASTAVSHLFISSLKEEVKKNAGTLKK